MTNKDPIYFCGGGYNCLSNFAAFQVTYDDTGWMTAEHAYQAAKFADDEIKHRIQQAPSAYQAQQIGREHQAHARHDWQDVNVEIMKDILQAKLSAHDYIADKLEASGQRRLVEDTDDAFWGRGPDGSGENKLGALWMQLRREQD